MPGNILQRGADVTIFKPLLAAAVGGGGRTFQGRMANPNGTGPTYRSVNGVRQWRHRNGQLITDPEQVKALEEPFMKGTPGEAPGTVVAPDGQVYAPTMNHAGVYTWAPVTTINNYGAGGPGGTGTNGTNGTSGGTGGGGLPGGMGGIAGGLGGGVNLPGLNWMPGVVGAGLGMLGALGEEPTFNRMETMDKWDAKLGDRFKGVWKDSETNPYQGDFFRNAKRDMITGTNAMIEQNAQKQEQQRLSGGQLFAGGNERAMAAAAPSFYQQTGDLLSRGYDIRDRAANFRYGADNDQTNAQFAQWQDDYNHGRLWEQNRGLNLVNKALAGGIPGFAQGMGLSSQLWEMDAMRAMLGGNPIEDQDQADFELSVARENSMNQMTDQAGQELLNVESMPDLPVGSTPGAATAGAVPQLSGMMTRNFPGPGERGMWANGDQVPPLGMSQGWTGGPLSGRTIPPGGMQPMLPPLQAASPIGMPVYGPEGPPPPSGYPAANASTVQEVLGRMKMGSRYTPQTVPFGMPFGFPQPQRRSWLNR